MATEKISVFYADDDHDDVNFFAEAINAANRDVEVMSRFDGGDLIDLLNNPPPSPAMIFLDWNMPGKDGAYVLKTIMDDQNLRQIPVIILSTSDYYENVSKARQLGAKMYLTKPYTFHELVNMLKYCLTINWSEFETNDNNFFYTTD